MHSCTPATADIDFLTEKINQLDLRKTQRPGYFCKPSKAMDGFRERHGCVQRVCKSTLDAEFFVSPNQETPAFGSAHPFAFIVRDEINQIKA
jgi:hypothetical protein